MEQLMSVFPAASKKHLPPTWQRLMCDPVSTPQWLRGWDNGLLQLVVFSMLVLMAFECVI